MAIDKKGQAEILKLMVDSYGVAVRAGLITPCLQDENAFRELLGLEQAPPEVIASWRYTEGIRRPVTIQDDSAAVDKSEQEESDGVE